VPFTQLETGEDNSSFEDNLLDETDITELLNQNYKMEQIQKAMKELDD
jgi:hypothetical protein